MKKKLFSIFAIILVMVIAFTLFAACDDPTDPDYVDDIVPVGEPRYYSFDSFEVLSIPGDWSNVTLEEYERQCTKSYIESEYTLALYDNCLRSYLNYRADSYVECSVDDNVIYMQDGEVVATIDGDVIEMHTDINDLEYILRFALCDPPKYLQPAEKEDDQTKPDDYYDQPLTELNGRSFEVDYFVLHEEAEGEELSEESRDDTVRNFATQELAGFELRFDDGKIWMSNYYGEYGGGEPYRIADGKIYPADPHTDEVFGWIEDNKIVIDWQDWSTYVVMREKGAPIDNDVSGNAYVFESLEIIPASSSDEAAIARVHGSLENYRNSLSASFIAVGMWFHGDGTAHLGGSSFLCSVLLPTSTDDTISLGIGRYFQEDDYIVGSDENGECFVLAKKQGEKLAISVTVNLVFGTDKAEVTLEVVLAKSN